MKNYCCVAPGYSAIVSPMIDWTKPVQLKNGKRARVLSRDVKSLCGETVVIAIQEPEGSETIGRRCPDGHYCRGEVSDLDCENIPEKVFHLRCSPGFTPVFKLPGGGYTATQIFHNRKEAVEYGKLFPNFVGISEIYEPKSTTY